MARHSLLVRRLTIIYFLRQLMSERQGGRRLEKPPAFCLLIKLNSKLGEPILDLLPRI